MNKIENKLEKETLNTMKYKSIISDNNKISDELIINWTNKLISVKSKNVLLIQNSNVIENHKYLEKMKNNLAIRNDVNRTKVSFREKLPNLEDELKKLLIFYCELNDIQYKQGMNEIFAVFYTLKIYNEHIQLHDIFNLSSLMLDYYFTNYFYEEEIYALTSSTYVVELLLKYHEPELINFFEKNFITPQVYATNWLLTVFSNKNEPEITFTIYNFLIEEFDQANIFYLIVAFYQKHKQKLLSLNNLLFLNYYSKMKIETFEELNEIINNAKRIKNETPYSLYILIDSLEIFKPKSKNLKQKFELIKPDQFPAFPIFPSELLFIAFPSVISCPDIVCKNFNNSYEKLEWPIKENICSYCFNNRKKRDLNYCFFDLRIFSNNSSNHSNHEGIIPSMHFFDPQILSKSNIENEVVKKANLLKEKCHLVLITNLTQKFEEFENNLYKLNLTKKEIFQLKIGIYIEKDKQLIEDKDMKKFMNEKNIEIKELKEYDNLKKVIKSLISNKHKYISFLYGGFEDLHQLSNYLHIPLMSHDKNICLFCLKESNKVNSKCIIDENTYFSLVKCSTSNTFYARYKEMSTSVIVSRSILLILTSFLNEKKEICYIIHYFIDKSSILVIDKYNKKNDSSAFILLCNNISRTNLDVIIIDFLLKEELMKFLNHFN